MTMEYHVNQAIGETKRVFPEQGRYGYLRYDMNENPDGLPETFVRSVLEEITPEFLTVYPEPDRFVKKYATFIGAKPENVLTTNGSDMAIRYLLETFGEAGKDVVTVTPTFEMYWVNCSILGLHHVPVSYEPDLTISVDKIIQAITGDTRIVALLNPNNPIGNVYSQAELERILDKAESVGAVVIIDEAYHYYYSETFLGYALKRENVIVLRTFSKLLSLAACRLGVVISNPQIINYVRNGRLTFDANALALLFAERLIEQPEIIDKMITDENEGRAYALERLCARSYECRDCRGNFILIKPKHDAHLVAERLKVQNKILVHTYNNDLLKKYIRVSTGSKQVMERFLKAFFTLDQNE